MRGKKFLYGDLTEKIIALVFKVYHNLDYGHPEKVYQEALSVELNKEKISYTREQFAKIMYDGHIIGRYFLDFLIEGKVAVELKVRRELYDTDWIQLLNYLKATGIKVGILIVIAKDGLKIKRVMN